MQASRESRASQSAGMRSTRSARLRSGAASRAAASASSENDDSSGGTEAARHSAAASSATAPPVSRSRPGIGLISMLHARPLAIAQRATEESVGSGSPAYAAECQLPASSLDRSDQG